MPSPYYPFMSLTGRGQLFFFHLEPKKQRSKKNNNNNAWSQVNSLCSLVPSGRVNSRSMVINLRIFSRPLIFISLNDKHALCYSSFSFKAQIKWPNILKGAFIRLTISWRGIHRITVKMTCYFNCGRSGTISETLRSTISLYGYG